MTEEGKMRIAIGSLQCESNSLAPIKTKAEDFDRAFGEAMFEKVHIMDMLEERGIEPVPTLYAHALPGGPVDREAFLGFVERMVDGIPATGIDGIWLYLHGAMYVEGIGSGEEYLLKEIRNKTGYGIPISIGMDFHANNSDAIFKLANVICGFRTAPHTDRIETERRAMRLLFDCLQKRILPRPQCARASVIIPGDAVLTSQQPLKRIMERAEEIEKEPGILCAQVFNGQAWVDVPYAVPNMVVTHESDPDIALRYARELARMFYDFRHEFHFQIEALEPDEAIKVADEAPEEQVFLSDSGDNTTAGAAGDNAFLLNRLIRSGVGRVLLAGITDKEAVDVCYHSQIGEQVNLSIGGSLDVRSEKAVVSGILKSRGEILGYTGENAGPCAVVDCGRITVLVTRNRTAVTSMEMFKSIGLDISPYKIVVVKLGYLFPGLARIAKRSILAFTPGSSTERLQDMGRKNIQRPVFPLDDDFI